MKEIRHVTKFLKNNGLNATREQLVLHPVQTWNVIKDGIVDDFRRQVIEGDDRSRSEYEGRRIFDFASLFIGVGEVKMAATAFKEFRAASKAMGAAEEAARAGRAAESVTRAGGSGKIDQTLADSLSKQDGLKETVGREINQAESAGDSRILSIEKGNRPDPSTYLSQNYIQSHLAQFDGGVTKISASAPTGVVGPPGGTFVMPKAVADKMIAESGGDVAKLEKLLSLEPGTLGSNPVRIDISSPSGLRMSSGNELGANSRWVSGGYTGGGIPEATVDPARPGTYSVSPIN